MKLGQRVDKQPVARKPKVINASFEKQKISLKKTVKKISLSDNRFPNSLIYFTRISIL